MVAPSGPRRSLRTVSLLLDVYFDDIDAPFAGPTAIRATSANWHIGLHPVATLKQGAVASGVARLHESLATEERLAPCHRA
jgi:hypothetical protein